MAGGVLSPCGNGDLLLFHSFVSWKPQEVLTSFRTGCGEPDDKLERKGTTHLVFGACSGGRVKERQLHHRLPDVLTRTFSCHLKLNRIVQVGLPNGENGPVRPHAEEGVAAPEDHGFIPRAVVEFHWRQTDNGYRSVRKPIKYCGS